MGNMQTPDSFKQNTRSELLSQLQSLHCIGLHSYELPTVLGAIAGISFLSDAILDNTRQQRPSDWHAVLLFSTADKPEDLAKKLASINELCPLKTFVEAERFANSFETLDKHKMRLPTDTEQSFEWQVLSDCLSLPALSDAFNDASQALIANEGTTLISDIDISLAELIGLKLSRDNRLTQTSFEGTALDIETMYFTANSASNLAGQIKALGDNNKHWAYLFFVGSADEIKPLKELFL